MRLPWWLRIASQRRGHGFNPWLRKIPHAPEQLSLWPAPGVAYAPRAGALQQQNRHEEQPPQREAWAPKQGADPISTTRETRAVAEGQLQRPGATRYKQVNQSVLKKIHLYEEKITIGPISQMTMQMRLKE